MRAKDIMSPNVITIGLDASVEAIAQLLMDKRISAAPVVDGDGNLAGIVSEGDLVRRISGEDGDQKSWWMKILTSDVDKADSFIKVHGRRAKDIMTRNVITVEEDTELSDLARTLETHRIKRVPVLRDGKLAGIVSRSNMLQVVATRKIDIRPYPAPGDREIREQVHDVLVAKGFATHGSLNVIVDDGIVELWGWVETEPERDAMLMAAAEVQGVKKVKDHFGKVAPWVWGA